MSAHEKLETDRWLIEYLEADPTFAGQVAGVYSEVIPENKPLPACRFSLQSATDVSSVNQTRIMVRLTYLVVVTLKGRSPAPLAPLAKRLDQLLHKAVGETDALTVLSSTREAPYTDQETVSGDMYWHAGGFYQVQVQAK